MGVDVRSAADLVHAFEAAIRGRVQAVRLRVFGTTLYQPLPHLEWLRVRVADDLSAREFAGDGGLMAYAPDYPHLYSRSRELVDRIFKGEKPPIFPLRNPRDSVVINLKSAKALGLTIPPTLLARADEVIE